METKTKTLDIIEKLNNSSITRKEVEFNFFMPVSKLSGNSLTYKNFVKNNNSRTVETEFGTMEIRNRLLTENHQLIISAIIKCGTIAAFNDGRIGAFFKEIDIINELNLGKNNYAFLRENIKRIGDAQYYITVGDLVRKVSIFQDHVAKVNGKRGAHAVVFDPEYINIYKSDFSVNYQKLFSKISSIPYPTIPSIIKYLMHKNRTSKSEEFSLSDVLKKIGFPVDSPSSLKEIVKNMKKAKKLLKDDYGIDYDDEEKMIRYRKHKNIEFNDPLESSLVSLDNFKSRTFQYEKSSHIIKDIYKNDEDGNSWTIETNIKKIEIKNQLDDLLFFLDLTTGDKVLDLF